MGKDEFIKVELMREESAQKKCLKDLKPRAVGLNNLSLPKLPHGLVSRWVSASNFLNFVESQNHNWVGLEGP